MALRSILLKITGDPADAKRALAETTAALKDLDGQTAEARVSIKEQAIRLQIEAVKARLERLSAQEATPKVQIQMGRAVEQIERLEAKLAKLDGKDVTVDVNVDQKGGLSAVSAGITGAAGAMLRLASAATAGIPALSRLITSLGAIGPAALVGLGVILPLLAALASSLAAAAAGAALLGVALAGALGPVALVAVAAIAKLVAVFKAAKEHSDGAAAATQRQAGAAASIAAAQDGVRSATEGLARAQDNLREQTTNAYRAWRDSIEAVKDSLLGVEHAQLGIDDANLSLREAEQALRNFREESGAAGDEFRSIFDKFTDVSVDTSGLRKALAEAQSASGGSLSDDDQLKLERLILNVREAKLREKDATDRLHDANTQLARDRNIASDFAKRGIAAYGPYRQAIDAVTAANRALAASHRQLAQAKTASVAAAADVPPAPSGAAADLVESVQRVKNALNRAFGPALVAIFSGATRGLDEFAKAFKDRRIQDSLTGIGVAIGDVFVSFGKLFANKEFRDGFVKLAEGGAKLVTILGERIFKDFVTLMVRLAVAALPDLISLMDRLADKFHVFVAGTRDGERLRKKVRELIDETRAWIRAFLTIGRVIVGVTNFLADLASAFKKQVGEMLQADKEMIADIRQAWRQVKTTISNAARDAVQFVKDRFNGLTGFFSDIGGKSGRAFGKALKAALGGLTGLGRAVANALIDAINFAARTINGLLPNKINIKGLPDVNLPDNPIPTIPRLAAGGIATRSVIANIGEAGREAILPLTQNVLRQLGLAISAATPTLRTTGLQPVMAGVGGGGTHIDNFHAHVKAPAGELPDVQTTATALVRLVERRAGGDPGQGI